MKHLTRLLSSLMAFTLVACGAKKTITGTYAFQLGSDKDTHIGIFMELTDNDYIGKENGEDKVFGKEFILSADLSGAGGATADDTASVEEDDISALGDQDFEIKGYYSLGTGEEKGRLLLGTTVLDDFYDLDSSIEIPDDFIKNILYATIKKNVLTVYVPVSMKDLAYQLYWYGYRIDVNALLSEEESSESAFTFLEETHDIGTHPTAEDIEKIIDTETAKGLEDNIYESFRDYHTLSMGLIK